MAKIRILPEILSNQIAAGEVVQRPASVVKELVENSMDAGADRVTVEIEKGGKSLIRISDNGQGLCRDDALLAIERYATSKIFSKEDLFSIATFGFRGEALPSIASVSKFTLVSRTAHENSAVKIDISGGRLNRVDDTGAPAGTMVEVRQLFFNTPARRKFLKAETTEAGHISDAVSGLAMGNPKIGFRLFMNQKLVRNYPPGQDLFQRAQMVLGRDAARQLYRFRAQEDEITVSGVCANPAVTRSTGNKLYFFVNQRLVHDRGLVSALFRGYRGRIMKGRYPMAVVCVDLPYDQVDVNVHPAKREIKFLSGQPVYALLGRTVGQALEQAQEDPLAYARSSAGHGEDPGSRNKGHWQTRLAGPGETAGVQEDGEGRKKSGPGFRPPSMDPVLSGHVAQSMIPWGEPPARETAPPVHDGPAPALAPDSGLSKSPVLQGQTPGAAQNQESAGLGKEVRILGQVLGTYIVAEHKEALVLVDQHAAHERVVYEALKRRHKALDVQSQTLMVPEVLELSLREANALESILDNLKAMGILIEPFGGTTFVVKAIPVLLEEKPIAPLVVEMIDALTEHRDPGVRQDWQEACLVSMACHNAIRANRPMTRQEMERLVMDLMACDNPMHCPHGRPILLGFDRNQLEKLFKRVV